MHSRVRFVLSVPRRQRSFPAAPGHVSSRVPPSAGLTPRCGEHPINKAPYTPGEYFPLIVGDERDNKGGRMDPRDR